MLTRLFVRQLGLLETVDISPKSGLTVVTGETGAGKSMLMDALSLTLGERADTGLIRQGADAAQAEATFSISEHSPLRTKLEEADILLDDGELTLRRTVPQTGSSKALANGARITAQQLKSFGEHLADIHGQHEHQLLLNSKRHGDILDHFGQLTTEKEAVKTNFKAFKKAASDLADARARRENQDAEALHLRDWLEELDALNYTVGEEEELADFRRRLMNVEDITSALTTAQQTFNAEDAPALLDLIGEAERALTACADKGGETLNQLAERMSALYAEAADIDAEIGAELGRTEADPNALQEADNRLAALRDIARKHHITIPDIPAQIQTFTARLEGLDTLEEDIAALEKMVQQTQEKFQVACEKLSDKRKIMAQKLKTSIEAALKTLHMPHCTFAAQLVELEPEKWTQHGAEKVEFHVSTNPGQPLQPLVKVASGGEVSRLMLALKVVFYAHMPAMTLVFDEIDTGLGGAVADAVGDALKTLASAHQVFAITHQPQVAAKGHAHLKIEKHVSDNNTHTTLTFLDAPARKTEVARMLSGKEITPEATAAAERMLLAS